MKRACNHNASTALALFVAIAMSLQPRLYTFASLHSRSTCFVSPSVICHSSNCLIPVSPSMSASINARTLPRLTATRKKSTLSYAEVMNLPNGNLDPCTITEIIPLPKSLSPSSAAEFKACPQSYLFQYLYNIKQPPNLALAKGSMCHSALEQLFDLQPKDRTLEHLQNLFRKNWSEKRLSDYYKPLFEIASADATSSSMQSQNDAGAVSVAGNDTTGNTDNTNTGMRDLQLERQWGTESLNLLSNYYKLEDPRLVPRPNPLEREIWVSSKLRFDLDTFEKEIQNDEHIDEEKTFLVRGIVDRLDYVVVPPSNSYNDKQKLSAEATEAAVRIVDYKTGKAPEFKYSPSTNERIAHENMWQLKIYALLLTQMIQKQEFHTKTGNLKSLSYQDIRLLRLMYLTSAGGEARYLDMDLGETQEERDAVLQQTYRELATIWIQINELIQLQDPTKFHHCDRRWCVCHKIRSKFVSGSVAT